MKFSDLDVTLLFVLFRAFMLGKYNELTNVEKVLLYLYIIYSYKTKSY